MKILFTIFFVLCCSAKSRAQDTIFVYLDDQKAAQAIITPIQVDVNLEIKKSYHKRAKSFIIQVYGEHISGQVYRRDLEITGDSITYIRESAPGIFDLSQSDIKKQLLTGKILKLYLRMNPSNPSMAIPSRKVYLGNLVMK
jgi:hypothetical protein